MDPIERSRAALVARRVRHVGRDEHLIAGRDRHAPRQPIAVADRAAALEQQGDRLDAAMV